MGALVFDRPDGRSTHRIQRAAQQLQAVRAHGDRPGRRRNDVVGAHEAGHELGARRVEHLTRRTGLLDPALVHDHHLVGQRHRFFLRMGHVHEGEAQLLLPTPELGAHLHPQERIERRQRLIQQQHPRLGHQGTRQCDPLLLAAGQFGRQAALVSRHRHQLEQLARPRVALGRRLAADLPAEGHVVQHVQVREQRIALEHHGGAALGRAAVGDVLAAQQNLARTDALVAGDHPQGGRLAAARGPEQAAIAARGNAQVDAVDRRGGTVALGQRGELQRRVELHVGAYMQAACQ